MDAMENLKRSILKMFHMLLFVALLSLLTLPVAAQQDLPTHFTSFGLGFQNSATQRTSGSMTSCVLTTGTMYACLATDYSGSTTSTRAEAHQLFYRYRNCALFGTGGAGAATGSTGGVGGSFDAGGVAACRIPRRIARADGVYATFSGSWQKRNVVEAPDIGTVLRAFGEQTVWRFSIGKGW